MIYSVHIMKFARKSLTTTLFNTSFFIFLQEITMPRLVQPSTIKTSSGSGPLYRVPGLTGSLSPAHRDTCLSPLI